tara:strand:- start:6130 stop:6402 length:273 start_codon:yes stop_codon:yes gene_type:complete
VRRAFAPHVRHANLPVPVAVREPIVEVHVVSPKRRQPMQLVFHWVRGVPAVQEDFLQGNQVFAEVKGLAKAFFLQGVQGDVRQGLWEDGV